MRPSRTQPPPRHPQSARARSREPATPLTRRRRSTSRRAPATHERRRRAPTTHRHEEDEGDEEDKGLAGQPDLFFLILFLAFCCLTPHFFVYSFFSFCYLTPLFTVNNQKLIKNQEIWRKKFKEAEERYICFYIFHIYLNLI